MESQSAKSIPAAATTSHLVYLDGLRGLAALYVVAHHAYMEVVAERTPVYLPFLLRHATNWLYYGQVAVDVFIVLSGYCLMLPAARGQGCLRGGVAQYLYRRARRILPPYYAALALSLLLIAVTPGMARVQGHFWDVALPAFSPGTLLSHLLLLHNLKSTWLHGIDPPMWSVATEWQIYFVFPLLLLPVWRRMGNIATLGIAFGVGLLPHFLLHKFDGMCPWFIGLFTLGMTAAAINTKSRDIPFQNTRRVGTIAALMAATFVCATLTAADWLWKHVYVMDIFFGIMTACLLVYCSERCCHSTSARPLILRVLETPFAVSIAAYSYSLYLVHFPLLSWLHLWLRPLHLGATTTLFLLLCVGAPLSMLASYIFHLLFERRFMPGFPRNKAQAEAAAIISPAP